LKKKQENLSYQVNRGGCYAESIRNAETEHIEDMSILITDFHAPGSFVCFPQLDYTVGGPLGRIQPESGLSAKLITVEPPVVNEGRLGHRIEGCETIHLAYRYRKDLSLADRSKALNLFAHGRVAQNGLGCGRIYLRRLRGNLVLCPDRTGNNRGRQAYEKKQEKPSESKAHIFALRTNKGN